MSPPARLPGRCSARLHMRLAVRATASRAGRRFPALRARGWPPGRSTGKSGRDAPQERIPSWTAPPQRGCAGLGQAVAALVVLGGGLCRRPRSERTQIWTAHGWPTAAWLSRPGSGGGRPGGDGGGLCRRPRSERTQIWTTHTWSTACPPWPFGVWPRPTPALAASLFARQGGDSVRLATRVRPLAESAPVSDPISCARRSLSVRSRLHSFTAAHSHEAAPPGPRPENLIGSPIRSSFARSSERVTTRPQ